MSPIEEKCHRFYSYGTDIYDVGIIGEKWFIREIGKDKFFILTGAMDKETKDEYYGYVVKEKHIRFLQSVDHLGDIESDKSHFVYKPEQGVFEIHYAALPVEIKDNAFVEDYLETLFGQYRPFIKEWLAVYTYTNYKKLPTLVLKGPRGSGKNKFAEMVMSIYPSIAQLWHGKVGNFTPEVQKKLLVADESVSAQKEQYRMLKQYSGQSTAMVNEKYQPAFQVKNNMNIIVLSNDGVPIFVEKDELPESEKNNQFFVCHGPHDSPK